MFASNAHIGNTKSVNASNENNDYDLYIVSLVDKNLEPRQLTDTPGDEWHPAWSPSQSMIVFMYTIDNNVEIYSRDIIDGKTVNLT